MIKAIGLVIVSGIFLCACSLFTVPKADDRIMLFAENIKRTNVSPIKTSIGISSTTSSPFLASNLVLIRSDNSLRRVKDVLWVDSVAPLVNYITLSSFRSSSRFTSISTDTEGIVAKYNLQTSIVRWNIEEREGKYYVVCEVYANIVYKRKSEIIAQHTWELEESIPSLSIDVISGAFQKISSEMMELLIEWTEENIERIEKNT